MNRKKQSLLRDMIKQYGRTLAVFFMLLLGAIALLWLFFGNFTWQATDSGWWILHWLHKNIVALVIICFLSGALIAMAFFSWKAFHRIGEEVGKAAGQMAKSPETPVLLSPMLKDAQDDLNEVRGQLLRKDYLAKEAEQRKNDLIVYLAHDLKTPLTSVIGYLSLLKEEPELPEEMKKRYAGIALAKAERLEQLINEFFEITRFNLTAMELKKETINLSMMLGQISSEFEPLFAERRLSCRLEVEPDIQVCCDPDKWERVIDNLLRNAIHFSRGGTEILLSLKKGGNSAVMQISNHSGTIPKEKLDRIFEQFFRLSPSRNSSTGGAGLGLAITKEIVKLHGGGIVAENEDGITTFTVTLPEE